MVGFAFDRRCRDNTNPGGTRVSGERKILGRFHRRELNSPVNLLINRAFWNVVVMDTIDVDSYLSDKWNPFESPFEQLPPILPLANAAVAGR